MPPSLYIDVFYLCSKLSSTRRMCAKVQRLLFRLGLMKAPAMSNERELDSHLEKHFDRDIVPFSVIEPLLADEKYMTESHSV